MEYIYALIENKKFTCVWPAVLYRWQYLRFWIWKIIREILKHIEKQPEKIWNKCLFNYFLDRTSWKKRVEGIIIMMHNIKFLTFYDGNPGLLAVRMFAECQKAEKGDFVFLK